MAEAHCPASCGELIQGPIGAQSALISCPINWFSTVSVEQGRPSIHHERPMMRQALKATLTHLNLPTSLGHELRIEFDSTIPVAKGMASSTADISATIVATARHFNQTIDEPLIATIASSLESTDSTMFRSLTLFRHQLGEVVRSYSWQPNINILLLESDTTLTTSLFHQRHDHDLKTLSQQYHPTRKRLESAMQQQCTSQLGIATTMSATFSQAVIPKPEWATLLKIVEQCDLLGLNVAHSGTIVGLLYHEAKHDIDRVVAEINRRKVTTHYPHYHQVTMVMGGVR
jgi:L-threonine kinase